MLTLATEIWRSNVSETLRPRLSLPMIFYLMEANSLAITNMLVEWWGVGPNFTMQISRKSPPGGEEAWQLSAAAPVT